MSPTGTLRLDSRESIDGALAARVYLRVFMPRLEVAPPGMDAESVRLLQSRVDRLADECGCGVGAGAALGAVAAWVAYAATIGPTHGIWGAMWRCAAALFAGATVGKLIGVGRARMELRGILVGLRASMAPDRALLTEHLVPAHPLHRP